MRQALALLEFEYTAHGLLAVDGMLKNSPIALLRCGTVHPGRYLALVGGSVASVEEAHRVALAVGQVRDDVLLPDPHPALAAALTQRPEARESEAMGVFETRSSPALLRGLDAALKAVPVDLAELRLGDDLGGRGLAVLTGSLTDVTAALDLAQARAGDSGWTAARSVLPRVEPLVRRIVAEGTHLRICARHAPEGAETVEG
ncbi:BMC domain-containing protein [bacterium]|nr:BMC domain-containing protein [bacterium]HPF34649.1 BMC domain-containing protein [Candidatus Krumholzibacteria bacterium]HRX51034.1 BMC domain-containing protein [Candidatus Krumholzibacteria bacterium]